MGVNEFIKKSKEELKKELTKDQFEVTQKNATEAPYSNAYFNEFREGIYVDITTGEPLFVSADKFDSGCGWPSFAKPLDQELIVTKSDQSYGMMRTEVRSKLGDAHLGHVFDDGIEALGGLRYCINSASLKFISKDQLEEVGYGKYKRLFECTGDKE